MKLKKLFKYIRFSKGQSVSMRKRLFLYMLLLFIMVVLVMITGLVLSGIISIDDDRINESMSMRLDSEEEKIKEEIDAVTVQGISMSQNLGRETENILSDEGIDKDDLNNNIEVLDELQNSYYGYMDTAVQVSEASGVYAFLDATANTGIAGSESSKSGIWLRVSNIDLKEKAGRELNLYRGIADIGREKGLRMNNQWRLEFDINSSDIEIPAEMMNNAQKSYTYTKKNKLENMWEEVVLLAIPFAGSDGTVYGMCGLELSEALFSLRHTALESEYGSYITVLAPSHNGKLYISDGLLGGTKDTFITEEEELDISSNGKFYQFKGKYRDYIGIMRSTKCLGDDNDWTICVITPENNYTKYMANLRLRWLLILLTALTVSLVLSIILSRRYVNPVISEMEAMKDNKAFGSTGYSEIDELFEFMKSESTDEKIVEEKLPENIAVLFDRFAENCKKLSPAEWIVMNLYIEGHEISEIPELAFISMATVRKHNRNIYEKLEVASRDELMLYIDLFRRIGRLDDLKEEKGGNG